MSQIQSFDSTQESDRPFPKMKDVFAAITVNLEMAENLLSRIVKTCLHEYITDAHTLCEHPENTIPCWVVNTSMVSYLHVPDHYMDSVVHDLLISLSEMFHRSVVTFEGRPLLLGAAQVKIRGMGGDVYNFSVRVQYAIGHSSPEDAVNFIGGTSAKVKG